MFFEFYNLAINVHIVIVIVLDVIEEIIMFFEFSDTLCSLGYWDCELLWSERCVGQKGGRLFCFYRTGHRLELLLALDEPLDVLGDVHLFALDRLFFRHWGHRNADLFLIHFVNWYLHAFNVFGQGTRSVLWLRTVFSFVLRLLVFHCLIAIHFSYYWPSAWWFFLCCCWLGPRLFYLHCWVLFRPFHWTGRYWSSLHFFTRNFSSLSLLLFRLLFLHLIFFILSWSLYPPMRAYQRRRNVRLFPCWHWNLCSFTCWHWNLCCLDFFYLLYHCYLLYWRLNLFWPLFYRAHWVYLCLSDLFGVDFSTVDSQHVWVFVKVWAVCTALETFVFALFFFRGLLIFRS